MTYPIDKYKTQAAKTFPALVTTFSTWTNWWQIGNVFDTLTDYLLRYPDAEKTITGRVVEIALDRYLKAASSACWYDDYGWWGVASEKAFHSEFAQIFAGHDTTYQDIARQCWIVMNTGKPGAYSYRGAPNAWENRENGSPTGYFTAPDTWAVPRFTGGVWQWEIFKDRRATGECSPSNPSDPNTQTLGPFQLTVMNGLYLVLALRLGDNGNGTAEAITNEMGFLNNWFDIDLQPGADDEGLLIRFPPSLTLVRERVPTYAFCAPRGINPSVQPNNAEAAWCGDQGLILGGLLDYQAAFNPSDQGPQQQALSIAGGVLAHMVKDQVVQPVLNITNDLNDYGCGSGVFWRYLLRGFQQNGALRDRILAWVQGDPTNNAVFRSAEFACNGVSPGNALFRDFNVLATLTAAIDILEAADSGG
jgi:hypothetical protein